MKEKEKPRDFIFVIRKKLFESFSFIDLILELLNNKTWMVCT